MKRRPELRIIVSSATIDAESFKEYFSINETGDMNDSAAVIMSIEGRMYPVG
jgi:ATP-dependent RNA helicase DDX35